MQEANVEITIDGQKVACQPGESIIAAADRHGIYIPRFCYHERLSVVANCRICLVEVVGAPKALPACATPVAPDMAVKTQSQTARSAQKAVMQFLLINHPLDCPICDQGGECDLQDIAMGYGAGVSTFTDKKRAVLDEDLGPLVATEMTRCIHCTRCVRFGDEIAGIPELVLTQRGGQSKISTYLEKGLDSELSGNMIDVCPVGALTSKPFRFNGRSWGFAQHDHLAMHDCIGSNMHLHVDKTAADGQPKVMRVVPKTNEAVNEQWLSDTDRFSYQGILKDRVIEPMIKKRGKWQTTDWYTALDYAARGLRQIMVKHGDNQVAVITNPQASLEEAYMQQLVMRAEGIVNIDHRYRMRDFSYDAHEALYPGLNLSLSEIAACPSFLIIGGDIRRQQPLLNHRIRQAVNAGATVSLMHGFDPEYNFKLNHKLLCSPELWVEQLEQLLLYVEQPKTAVSAAVKALSKSLVKNGVILLGLEALHHANYGQIRHLAEQIAQKLNLKVALVTDGPNTAGMHLAGVIPHRGQFNTSLAKAGNPEICNFTKAAKAYWLHQVNCFDSFQPEQAKAKLEGAEFVVSCLTHIDEHAMQYSDVILPLAVPTETSGIWVNAEGRWQTAQAATTPYANAKSGWKIYRALADCFEQDHVKFDDLAAIRAELTEFNSNLMPIHATKAYVYEKNTASEALVALEYWPANQVDALVRAADALQALPRASVLVNEATFNKYAKENQITINKQQYQCQIQTEVADNTVIVPLYDALGDK